MSLTLVICRPEPYRITWIRMIEKERGKKKSHYLLKRRCKGSNHRSSKWGENRERGRKKKAQVSIFIHIQKQVALESEIANFHFCRDALLWDSKTQMPVFNKQYIYHGSNLYRGIHLKHHRGRFVDIALISISLIAQHEVFCFVSSCHESYAGVKLYWQGLIWKHYFD